LGLLSEFPEALAEADRTTKIALGSHARKEPSGFWSQAITKPAR
jgi:hypothetical protein